MQLASAKLLSLVEPAAHLHLSPAVAERVRLTNAVALLTTCTTLMGTPLFAWVDLRAGLVESLFAFACFAAFGLNRMGWTNLSRIWLPFVIAAGLGLFTIVFGENAGLAFGFVIPMLMISWLHTREERLHMLAGQALLIALQVGSLLAASQISPLVPLTESLAALFRVPLAVVMNLAVGGVAFGFAIVFHSNEQRLEAVNDSLSKEIEQHLETADKLRQTAKLAQAAAQAKTDFLANMTHELRTPLSAVVSLTTFALEASSLPASTRSDLEEASTAANQALNVIGDIMDVSQGVDRKLTLAPKPILLDELITQIAREAKGQAAEVGSSFHLESRDNLGLRTVDGLRLQQILRNLIQNALRFASDGGATLRVKVGTDDVVEFEVIDDGIGMTETQLQHVFEPFYQAQLAANRNHQGTGLGASLAAQLVGLMGGRLQAESTPNVQTRFWFAIDLPAVVPITPLAAPERQVFRILAAEDNRVNQMIVSRMVVAAGHECIVVEDGEKAVEACRNQVWSLILMDMQMPHMDGLEATVALREAGYQGAIVALTANALDQDRDRCMAAGMDGYLTKPLKKDALARTLAKFARTVPEWEAVH